MEKLNARQFVFFCKHVQPILENYTLIYELIHARPASSHEDSAGVVSVGNNEKEFIKSVQTSVFERMQSELLATGGVVARVAGGAYDMEALSLNMINNSLMTLKQFGALRRGRQHTANEIDRPLLWSLIRKLKYVLNVLRPKLNETIRLARSIDPNDDERDFSFCENGNLLASSSTTAACSSSPQKNDQQLIAEYQELFTKAKI